MTSRQGIPLPEARQRPAWRTGSYTSRGGKLIDVELLGDIKGELALGRVTHVGGTTSSTGYSTEADVSNITVTFDGATGRYYKVTWIARIIQQTSAGTVTARITDSSNTSQIAWVEYLTAGAGATINLFFIVKPGEGSFTYKARLGTSAGTVDVNASSTAPQFLIVEDMGL